MSNTQSNLNCNQCGSTDVVDDASVRREEESTQCLPKKPFAKAGLGDCAQEDSPFADGLRPYDVSYEFQGIGFSVNALNPSEAAREVAMIFDTHSNHRRFAVKDLLTLETFDVFVCGADIHVSPSFNSVFANSRQIPLIDTFFQCLGQEESQRMEIALRIWDHILDTNFGDGAQCLDLFNRAFKVICDQRFSVREARCIAINLSPAVLSISNMLNDDRSAQYKEERHVVPFIFAALIPALRDIKALTESVQRTIPHHDANRLAVLISQQLSQL